MKCPVCKDPDLTLSERQGIEIDYCPQCRGVWLDRGELDKIIERSDSFGRPDGRPAVPVRGYDDDRRYPHKRRKSFLSELFD